MDMAMMMIVMMELAVVSGGFLSWRYCIPGGRVIDKQHRNACNHGDFLQK
jgi:hypothetical protein